MQARKIVIVQGNRNFNAIQSQLYTLNQENHNHPPIETQQDNTVKMSTTNIVQTAFEVRTVKEHDNESVFASLTRQLPGP